LDKREKRKANQYGSSHVTTFWQAKSRITEQAAQTKPTEQQKENTEAMKSGPQQENQGMKKAGICRLLV